MPMGNTINCEFKQVNRFKIYKMQKYMFVNITILSTVKPGPVLYSMKDI